ncbi:hypothetical protein B9Z55_026954 [Caenorhabditis nigoni]|uniref:F-box domain-containing protein n=1 Tax=Caenorhabditis nigoni TaxID=1611254 RepID=A0A2G5SIN6_9PELO|nr:hypothetical protein B9Z55_026954 [Caenorhabditis nigoni]
MEKIPEFLKNNDHYLKSCILYEVALKKPIFDSYRNFCDTVGHNAMEYPDFEFWYCRFCQGEMDFDYDRSRGPVSKTLMDMPIKLMQKITEDMTPFEKRYLRSINHSIKDFTDSLPTVFEKIEISAYENKLEWKVNGNEYECKKEENGCTFSRPKCLNAEKCEKGCYRCKDENKITETFEESYIKKSLEYLTPLFKIPNLQINDFRFCVTDQTPELDDLLPVAFYAKSACIQMTNFDKMVQHLSNLKAGFLEEFTICFHSSIGKEHLTRIYETEQFKQAQGVKIYHFAELNVEDLTNFNHLKHFTLHLNPIEGEEILRIRDTISTFKNFEECSIMYQRNGRRIRSLAEVLEEYLEGPVEEFTHRYKNPAFNKTLDFKIKEWGHYFFIDVLKV